MGGSEGKRESGCTNLCPSLSCIPIGQFNITVVKSLPEPALGSTTEWREAPAGECLGWPGEQRKGHRRKNLTTQDKEKNGNPIWKHR